MSSSASKIAILAGGIMMSVCAGSGGTLSIKSPFR